MLAYSPMVATISSRTFCKIPLLAGFAAFLACAALAPARGAEINIAPHQALYSLTLESAKSSSGVIAASGAMFYKWGEACDGWTVEQRFRLRIAYADEDGVDISSALVTWESMDGLKYRFNERSMRNGELDEELRGVDGSLLGELGRDALLPAGLRLRADVQSFAAPQHTELLEVRRLEQHRLGLGGDFRLLAGVFGGCGVR